MSADAQQHLALEVSASATVTPPADLKADELNRTGYDALRNGNYDQAVLLLKRVVELEPKHKTAWNYLGLAYQNLRQWDNAIDAFGKQVAINPYDEYAHNYIGSAYLHQRRYTEAETAFRKQIEINPLDKFAHGNLGRLFVETKRYDEAITELTQAISLSPDDAYLQIEIGTAYLNANKGQDALAAFDKAAGLSANPLTWNNIAYQLSLKGAHLDRAQQYAESAVSAVNAPSRNFTVDSFSTRELSLIGSMASYWDTLGWVHFAKGDLARAEPLVTASWRLGESAEVGDHLGQIFEKRGRKDDAIRMYALAMNADRPMQATRERLTALVGNASKADTTIREHANALVQQRTVTLDGSSGKGQAEFVVLFGAGSIAEGAAFVSGDDSLRSMTNALLKARYGTLFPDETPAKILRRGTVTCAAACTFRFVPLTETKPIQ